MAQVDREALLSAMIAAVYEDGDTAVVRQGMPSVEWNLLSIAADAALALVAGQPAERSSSTSCVLKGDEDRG